jgi:DNA-binding transcriptional LysR family regulator
MKLHFLRYFTVLAEELHFGRAAVRLSITQPPLSSAIKALEEELQVQLLVRNSKRVELTPAGAAYLPEARQILERIGRAGGIAQAAAKGSQGRVDMGMASSLVYRGVPLIVQQFERAHPGVELVIGEQSTAEQLDALLRGQLHVAFVNAAVVPTPLKSLPLRDDEFVLCLPQTHPAAGLIEIDLRTLAHERFVMFARDIAPANHDNVIAIFNRAGIHPRTVHAARQWLTIVAMVANGLGISLVPRSLSRSRVEGVSFVRFSGPRVLAPALLAWNPAHVSAAVASFLDCATRSLQEAR